VASAAVAKRVGDEIVRLSHAGLDPLALRTEIAARIERIIPSDTYWFPTIDPATLLVTGAVLKNIPEWAAPHFLENEFLEDDFNKFTHLVASATHVNSLFEATEGDLERSRRFRGLLGDLGLGGDLRAALVEGSACWGYLCLHRDRGSPGYTQADIAFLQPLVQHLAAGLRTSLLQSAPDAGDAANEPGLIVLAADLSIIAINDAAERWLDELGTGAGQWAMGLPDPVCATVARLWALERTDDPGSLPPPIARARTQGGRWLTLHASRLTGPDADGRVGVIIEPSQLLEVAPLIVQAYGLSARESQVTMLVLHGLSTSQISRRLRITENTVQDHLKAIFDKVGVRSRRDLAAQLAVRHYAPRGAVRQYPPRSVRADDLGFGNWFFDASTPADFVELSPDDPL
jgi:DNA-binding CsgD family transcriptional regulator